MLRHLAAEQRAPRGATTFGDAGDELVDLLGDEAADRDVVEEEQRLRALGRDVVDRHGDAVDADRVASIGQARDQRLGADAVGGRDEEGVLVLLPVDREEPTEAADVADDLTPERRPDVLLDELDGLLARRDVDPGGGIREPLLGTHAASASGARTPRLDRCEPRAYGLRLTTHALQPRHACSTVPGTSSVGFSTATSSASFVSWSGTGTG